MSINDNLKKLYSSIDNYIKLVAVSKTKSNEQIMEAYQSGQKIFGENKVQDLVTKYSALPKDIDWHMIGHLQRNKVKYIANFIKLIHSVDNFKLLKEINRQAKKNNLTIDCLLQIKIASEETKFGLSIDQVKSILKSEEFKTLKNISIIGLMGMASFTNNEEILKKEFTYLNDFFKNLRLIYPNITVLSMGMSYDYKLAIQHGSNMIRVGSLIFGERN
ncbi:MAG TPA: YggS family pyridoxal phosphate-dependent enzyme [Flavobacteriaceae bacterium]|nr:YggS family pyridoxal phosphate-dependent enzyme [Flavobacteriaceae bacterium]|tara:strand:+ start:1204 stop:1857 length:654 start_codon:yes stop_codon:yes gene_type:complete